MRRVHSLGSPYSVSSFLRNADGVADATFFTTGDDV